MRLRVRKIRSSLFIHLCLHPLDYRAGCLCRLVSLHQHPRCVAALFDHVMISCEGPDSAKETRVCPLRANSSRFSLVQPLYIEICSSLRISLRPPVDCREEATTLDAGGDEQLRSNSCGLSVRLLDLKCIILRSNSHGAARWSLVHLVRIRFEPTTLCASSCWLM